MIRINQITLTMWMVGVVSAGLWFSPCGIAQADSSSNSTGQNQNYVQYLQNKLSLTSDQTQQIQSILTNADAQLGPKPDASASQADRQAYYQKMQQTMQSTQSSISNVLTDQQKTQYAQLHSQHQGQRQGGGDSANGGNGNGARQGDWGGHRRNGGYGAGGQGPNYQWNSTAQDPLAQPSPPTGQRPWHKHRHHQDQNDGSGSWSNNQPNQNNSSY